MEMGNTCCKGNHDEFAAYIQESMILFLRLIMSKKCKEEQQKEAIEHLKSNPNLLIATVKLITNRCKQNPIPSEKPENGNSESQNNINSSIQVPDVNKDNEQDSVYYNLTNTSNSHEYPKRKRRSKYCDLDGDLSNIRRDPKCSKRNIVNDQNKETNTLSVHQTSHDSGNNDINRLLARKMIDILIQSGSSYHQECVLAILQADETLREAYLVERDLVGKQKVPIFKDIKSGANSPLNVSESCFDKTHSDSLILQLNSPVDNDKIISSEGIHTELTSGLLSAIVPDIIAPNPDTLTEITISEEIWREPINTKEAIYFTNDVSFNNDTVHAPQMLQMTSDQPQTGIGSDSIIEGMPYEPSMKFSVRDENVEIQRECIDLVGTMDDAFYEHFQFPMG